MNIIHTILSFIMRVRRSYDLRSRTSRFESAFLRAEDANTCLAALAGLDRDVAYRLAEMYDVEVGPFPLVTAMHLVAARWPGSVIWSHVQEVQRSQRSMLAALWVAPAVRA